MSPAPAVLQLHEHDLLLREAEHAGVAERRRRIGLPALERDALEKQRVKLAAAVDRRWLVQYERALQRYGRAVAAVRERVCAGCFISMPRSAAPPPGEPLTHCVSCGRILYWR